MGVGDVGLEDRPGVGVEYLLVEVVGAEPIKGGVGGVGVEKGGGTCTFGLVFRIKCGPSNYELVFTNSTLIM